MGNTPTKLAIYWMIEENNIKFDEIESKFIQNKLEKEFGNKPIKYELYTSELLIKPQYTNEKLKKPQFKKIVISDLTYKEFKRCRIILQNISNAISRNNHIVSYIDKH